MITRAVKEWYLVIVFGRLATKSHFLIEMLTDHLYLLFTCNQKDMLFAKIGGLSKFQPTNSNNLKG